VWRGERPSRGPLLTCTCASFNCTAACNVTISTAFNNVAIAVGGNILLGDDNGGVCQDGFSPGFERRLSKSANSECATPGGADCVVSEGETTCFDTMCDVRECCDVFTRFGANKAGDIDDDDNEQLMRRALLLVVPVVFVIIALVCFMHARHRTKMSDGKQSAFVAGESLSGGIGGGGGGRGGIGIGPRGSTREVSNANGKPASRDNSRSRNVSDSKNGRQSDDGGGGGGGGGGGSRGNSRNNSRAGR
jgi:hypothetical protein